MVFIASQESTISMHIRLIRRFTQMGADFLIHLRNTGCGRKIFALAGYFL